MEDHRSFEVKRTKAKKHVAISDVDATIASPNALLFNQAEMESLKEKGITEIYLLTSMTALTLTQDLQSHHENKSAFTRERVREHLKQNGFNAHIIVVTPMDCANAEYKVGDAYEKTYLPAYQVGIKLKKDEIYENDEIVKARSTLLKNYAEASDKAINEKRGVDIKYFMYRKLMFEHGEEIASAIYLEDSQACREAVKLAHETLDTKVRPHLTIIENFPVFDNKVNPTQYYDTCKPFFLDEITRHVNSIPPELLSSYNEQYYADKIRCLSARIQHMQQAYKELEGGLHSKNKHVEHLDKLIEEIQKQITGKISFKDKGKEKISSKEKFKQLIERLETTYLYRKNKTNFLNNPIYPNSGDMAKDFNAKDKDHHYYRMIGLILQELYLTDNTLDTKHKAKCTEEIDIIAPAEVHEFYTTFPLATKEAVEKRQACETPINKRHS